MRNIELKARYADLPAAMRIAESLGAARAGVERQRDTYFHCPHGRLKLRQRWPEGGERSDRCELIAYRRGDADRPRASDYTVVPVADGEAIGTALADALGTAVIVEKRRTVYLFENVRIHLDEVSGLGTFIEFEAVVGDGCDEAEAGAKVQALIAAFSVGGDSVIAGSYGDLPAER